MTEHISGPMSSYDDQNPLRIPKAVDIARDVSTTDDRPATATAIAGGRRDTITAYKGLQGPADCGNKHSEVTIRRRCRPPVVGTVSPL